MENRVDQKNLTKDPIKFSDLGFGEKISPWEPWERKNYEPSSREVIIYYIPYDIHGAKIAELEKRIEELEEQLKQKQEQEIFPIEFLESKKLRLKQPIIVRASYSSKTNTWVVDHFELNIYGEGRDIDEAVEDFKIALEEIYFDLKKEQDKLGAPLQKEWNLLQKLIEEK